MHTSFKLKFYSQPKVQIIQYNFCMYVSNWHEKYIFPVVIDLKKTKFNHGNIFLEVYIYIFYSMSNILKNVFNRIIISNKFFILVLK